MSSKFYILSTAFIFSFLTNLIAQEYFQQEVNYTIKVKLNDKDHAISAFETIEYQNNSPDILNFIYFHLWPNAYDNNSTALAKQKFNDGQFKKLFTIEKNRGYIDSLDFKVNGESVKMEYSKEHIDICKIILNSPLKSEGKITITTPFFVKIPSKDVSRLGHIGESYQITQWYPKPAVYDKYGWHQMPYLHQGEFYSEFGSFDVSITLPKNYIVGATGDLQNKAEIKWLNELADSTAKLTSFDKNNDTIPKSSSEFKTIQFIQKNIHDFAWFADKRFHVLKGEIELPNTKHKVTTWAMFPNRNANLWIKAIEYINDALYYYSKWYGDYPYNNCTAIMSGGGGMEYPNITTIGSTKNDRALEVVIMHEVGHNWFYGILGFNERRYTWQDEGINSFSEARYMETKYKEDDGFYKMIGKEKLTDFFELNHLRYKQAQDLLYILFARLNIDQHASLSAGEYSMMNYGIISYMKTGRIFNYLMKYLGEEKFDEIMQSFYEKWKYKHPYPSDLREIFETKTNKDLSWVFDDLLQTTKKLDYKIIKTKSNKVLVKNIGMINSPLSISGLKNNEIIFTNWHNGFDKKKWITFPKDSIISKLKIDHNIDMLELNRKNNSINTKGLFKKTESLRLKFAGAIENPDRTQVNYLPTMGWNNYNKYMLGMVLYNGIVPQSKFEYQIMPMYSFGPKDIAGAANFSYHIHPYNSKIQAININLSGFQYAYNKEQGDNFNKIKAEIDFHFRKSNPRKSINNHLILDGIIANNPEDIFDKNSSLGYIQVYNMKFSHTNKRDLGLNNFTTQLQTGDGFIKSSLEVIYKINYNYREGLNIRLFGGAFLYKKDNLSSLYYYRLSGTNGINDYTYSESFIGRFENPSNMSFLSNQYIANDGAFSTFTSHGQTDEWILAINITSSLPINKFKLLKVYANLSTFGNSLPVPGHNNLESFEWEAGAKISIIDYLEIFFPIIMSDDLRTLSDEITNKYSERIRFTLRLNDLNPFKQAKNVFN